MSYEVLSRHNVHTTVKKMITWHTGQGGEHLAQVKTYYPDSERKFQLGMHEATLPEFYSVCLSYAPVPVCKDTLP